MATVTPVGLEPRPTSEADGGPPDPGATSGSAPTFRRALLVVLVAALAASVATALWLLPDRGGESGAEQQQREQVMAQTRQFMLRMGTYGPDLLDGDGAMPEYRSLVKAVITAKFAASFDEQAGTAEQLVADAKVSRQAAVFATGVADVDPDSATTLVAGTFTDTYEVRGRARPQEPVPYRIEVSLVKIDGDWLVDDFTPVTGAEE